MEPNGEIIQPERKLFTMKLLFLISLSWVLYSSFGYLAILMIVTAVRRRPTRWSDDTPQVSLIIAAYNEEQAIEEKILNSLGQDYPSEKLEIIIASDCSSDGTDEIVSRFADQGVKLVRQPVRGGKTSVQNLALSQVTGEVLVFSDATTLFAPDTVSKLVRNFGDPSVGCVGGEPRFHPPGPETLGEEVSLYWRYERLLQRKESEFNSLIYVSGCVFAIRRELAEHLREDLTEDFAFPLKVLSRGYRVAYEPEAIAYEDMSHTGGEEFHRMVRVVVKGTNTLWYMKSLLNPIKHPLLAFQLFSHKISRWMTPYFLATLVLSTFVLMFREPVFFLLAVAMTMFVALSFLGGCLHSRMPLPRVIKIPYYLTLVNLAFLKGIFQFFTGKRQATWEPLRT